VNGVSCVRYVRGYHSGTPKTNREKRKEKERKRSSPTVRIQGCIAQCRVLCQAEMQRVTPRNNNCEVQICVHSKVVLMQSTGKYYAFKQSQQI